MRRGRWDIPECDRLPSSRVRTRVGRRSLRHAHARRNQRFTAADWARIHALLREDWSPEQVAGRLRRQGELAISHETIYRYIWADKRAGGALYRHLRGARKRVANATDTMTAAAGSRASARSRRAPRPSRPDANAGTGRRTRRGSLRLRSLRGP